MNDKLVYRTSTEKTAQEAQEFPCVRHDESLILINRHETLEAPCKGPPTKVTISCMRGKAVLISGGSCPISLVSVRCDRKQIGPKALEAIGLAQLDCVAQFNRATQLWRSLIGRDRGAKSQLSSHDVLRIEHASHIHFDTPWPPIPGFSASEAYQHLVDPLSCILLALQIRVSCKCPTSLAQSAKRFPAQAGPGTPGLTFRSSRLSSYDVNQATICSRDELSVRRRRLSRWPPCSPTTHHPPA